MTPDKNELLRSLPSVSAMLEHEEVKQWLDGWPRRSVITAVQAAIGQAREAMLGGRLNAPLDVQDLLARAEQILVEQSIPSLRAVINATGIVLHTGLGRAPLSEAAIEAIAEAASGYCNLEYDLRSGKRGRRSAHVVDLLTSISGAEGATVVNNNAAATLLILRTLAEGREVIVSRGQLIEIGGSYRLPDIMSASGAALREVGTTNRTRIADYERAITDRAAMLLRVHTSNFRVVGFTEDAGMAEIAALAHRYGLLAVDDLGSGALIDLARFGLPEEPCVRDSLAAGADLACFSGDKLLGGPQCGVIVGKRELVDRLGQSPLFRTYRVDKLTLLALEATLRCYLDPDEAVSKIPALAMLTSSTDALAEGARKLAAQLETALPNERFYVCSDVGFAGGGSMPAHELQTVVVQWRPAQTPAEAIVSSLRQADTPVIARIRDDAVCLDLRTLRESDFEPLVAAVSAAVWETDAQGPVAADDGTG